MADTGLTFTDALKQYFAANAGGATRALYEGLFPHMEKLGFKVERPTRSGRNPDGSKRLSSDKIVDSSTGALYDIIHGVDDVTGAGPWALGVPKDWAYWVDGKASRTPIPGATSVLGSPAPSAAAATNGASPGSRMNPNQSTPPSRGHFPADLDPERRARTGSVLGMPIDPSNPYAAANIAAMQQRGRSSNTGGRTSTVLGGFKAGKPKTRPSVLGGY